MDDTPNRTRHCLWCGKIIPSPDRPDAADEAGWAWYENYNTLLDLEGHVMTAHVSTGHFN